MYIPEHAKCTDLSVLDRLAEHASFGTLVSTVDSAPFATHLPVLMRRSGRKICIQGHWARPNPQWMDIERQRVLFIFHGPHAYISPQWYLEPGDRVPTWNYVAAHLYGRVRLEHDADRLREFLHALAEKYESGTEHPWNYRRASERTQRAVAGVVGFELLVDEVQIKQKLSQHDSEGNIRGAIAGLRAAGTVEARQVAGLMEDCLLAASEGAAPER